MLYGCPISETIPVFAAGVEQLTIQGVRPAPYAVYGRAQLLRRINAEVHELVPYPANILALPDALCNRVWALIVGEKRKKKGSPDYEPSVQKYAFRRAGEYEAMSSKIAQAVDAVHPDATQRPSHYAYYRCLVPVVNEHRRGHCGEYAALVVDKLLAKLSQRSIRLLKGELGEDDNHVCVVLGADPSARADDWRTYGGLAIVCDAWLDLVAQPSEYFRVLKILDCQFRPNAMMALHEQVR